MNPSEAEAGEVKADETTAAEPIFTEQDFVREYNELCEKGFQIVAVPGLVPTNHNSWEFQVTLSVVKK